MFNIIVIQITKLSTCSKAKIPQGSGKKNILQISYWTKKNKLPMLFLISQRREKEFEQNI